MTFVLVGYPPFSDSISGVPLNDQIIKGTYTFPEEFWSEVSESVKDLIRKMMCVDPVKRLTIDDVLKHPWLADDHENTTRVDKIMYPSLFATTSLTVKSTKRSADDDDTAEAGPPTRLVEEIPEATTSVSSRPKRVKH